MSKDCYIARDLAPFWWVTCDCGIRHLWRRLLGTAKIESCCEYCRCGQEVRQYD